MYMASGGFPGQNEERASASSVAWAGSGGEHLREAIDRVEIDGGKEEGEEEEHC